MDELSSRTNLFADNTLLFFVVHNANSSVTEINNELKIKLKQPNGRINGK